MSSGSLHRIGAAAAVLSGLMLLLFQCLLWVGSPSPLEHAAALKWALLSLTFVYPPLLSAVHKLILGRLAIVLSVLGIVGTIASTANEGWAWRLQILSGSLVLMAAGTALLGVAVRKVPAYRTLGTILLTGAVITFILAAARAFWLAFAATWLVAGYFFLADSDRDCVERRIAPDHDTRHPATTFVRVGELITVLSVSSLFIGIVLFVVQLSDRRQTSYIAAWQTITSAQDKGGNGGRVLAMEYLNQRHESLQGIVVANGDLSKVDLRRATLYGADFTQTDLFGADLRGADLHYAKLDHANLRCADLRQVKNVTGGQLSRAQVTSTTLLPEPLPAGYSRPPTKEADDEAACRSYRKGLSALPRFFDITR